MLAVVYTMNLLIFYGDIRTHAWIRQAVCNEQGKGTRPAACYFCFSRACRDLKIYFLFSFSYVN